MKLSTLPSNKSYVYKLMTFCNEVKELLKEDKIDPILYGSLALFVYTKKNIKVNDLDFLVPESAFKKIIPLLKRKRIRYEYPKKWHTLIIRKGNLKIELDSVNYWQPTLKMSITTLVYGDFKTKIVSKETLKGIYKRASEASKDNPEGNLLKYKMLRGRKKV